LNPWRLEGYRRGLRDCGLPRRRVWELATDLTEAGAKRAVEEFLHLAPRPTAVYCFNNTLARFVVESLRERGVTVPGDVSVMGGGGEESPGLTCHQADWYEMGRTAVKALLRTRADRRRSEHHLGPHTIQPGSTTANSRD
jgi:LacI family transcriptional regulator